MKSVSERIIVKYGNSGSSSNSNKNSNDCSFGCNRPNGVVKIELEYTWATLVHSSNPTTKWKKKRELGQRFFTIHKVFHPVCKHILSLSLMLLFFFYLASRCKKMCVMDLDDDALNVKKRNVINVSCVLECQIVERKSLKKGGHQKMWIEKENWQKKTKRNEIWWRVYDEAPARQQQQQQKWNRFGLQRMATKRRQVLKRQTHTVTQTFWEIQLNFVCANAIVDLSVSKLFWGIVNLLFIFSDFIMIERERERAILLLDQLMRLWILLFMNLH